FRLDRMTNGLYARIAVAFCVASRFLPRRILMTSASPWRNVPAGVGPKRHKDSTMTNQNPRVHGISKGSLSACIAALLSCGAPVLAQASEGMHSPLLTLLTSKP